MTAVSDETRLLASSHPVGMRAGTCCSRRSWSCSDGSRQLRSLISRGIVMRAVRGHYTFPSLILPILILRLVFDWLCHLLPFRLCICDGWGVTLGSKRPTSVWRRHLQTALPHHCSAIRFYESAMAVHIPLIRPSFSQPPQTQAYLLS